MLEYDMNDAEFLAPAAHEEIGAPKTVWLPSRQMYAGLALLTVAESEAAREGSR